MNEFVCNYSLIRFLPYRDAGEFVNTGVAMACGATNFLDFRIEAKRYARVTHFFPELDSHLYLDGVRALRQECDRWRGAAAELSQAYPGKGEEVLRHIFGELTRARESVFHFDMPRTLLTDNPSKELEKLFDRYVKRQFKQDEAHGENAMRRKIKQCLHEFGVERWYQSIRIGTPDYFVSFPFVMSGIPSDGQLVLDYVKNAQRVIKPLYLNRDSSSEITQYGDDWSMRLKRLQDKGYFPQHLLFSVQEPLDQRHHSAAKDVCALLKSYGAETVLFSDTSKLREFALPY